MANCEINTQSNSIDNDSPKKQKNTEEIKKYYCVIVGRSPGIYTTWKECEKQILKYLIQFKDLKIKELEKDNIEHEKVHKPKKEPNAYNIFFKEKMLEIKNDFPDMKDAREKMRMVAEAWQIKNIKNV
jgi:hypothetical protein